jgi:hypothetical protein
MTENATEAVAENPIEAIAENPIEEVVENATKCNRIEIFNNCNTTALHDVMNDLNRDFKNGVIDEEEQSKLTKDAVNRIYNKCHGELDVQCPVSRPLDTLPAGGRRRTKTHRKKKTTKKRSSRRRRGGAKKKRTRRH